MNGMDEWQRKENDKLALAPSRRAHKIMTSEEYAAMPIVGWHEVCRNVDGFGCVGIRFLGLSQQLKP